MLNILKYVIFLWNSQFFLYLDQKRTAFYNYLNEDIKRVEIFENYFIVPTFLQECEEFMETLKSHQRLRDSRTNPYEAN